MSVGSPLLIYRFVNPDRLARVSTSVFSAEDEEGDELNSMFV